MNHLRLRFLPLLALSLAMLTACGSDADPDDDASSQGAGGDGGGHQGAEHQANHDALAACGAPACAALFARKVEGGEAYAFEDWACVLEALRDRVPGAYDIRMEHAHSFGLSERSIRLLVTAAGAVETAEVHDDVTEVLVTTLLPTQRCTLKDPAFFEQCQSHIESVDPHPEGDAFYPNEVDPCFFSGYLAPLPWYAECQPLAPTCE